MAIGYPDGAYTAQLLVADTLVFSATAYATALLVGLQSQQLLPRGSLLDATHVALWNLVLTAAGARLVGPLTARAVLGAGTGDVQAKSVDEYALALGALVVLGALAFEATVVWPSRRLSTNDMSV